MRVDELKEYIVDNNYIETILEELGCGNIREHDGYFTASNPDGNNPQALTVYNNETLITINYTRNITKNKRVTDIFDLVSFYKDCPFPEALKYVHSILGLDYYSENTELPNSLQILKMLKDMCTGEDEEDNVPLKPISEQVLSYYLPYGNQMWENENISLTTQAEFGIAYDPQTNYIAIPIFDSIGSLVGVKGRYFGEPDEHHIKYLYLEKCNKSRVLYGYWQNKEFIKNNKYIIVVESEKSVLKLAEYGYRNVVSTGGKTISKHQVELVTRTGCIPIIAFDKDVNEDELQDVADMFMDGINVYAVIDKDNLLNEKESPMDRQDAWEKLYKECVFQLK
jgi:DNA primase